MTDILTAQKWLYAKLAADATLTALIGGAAAPRIFVDSAPEGTAYPLVLISSTSNRVVSGLGASVIMFNEFWMVKGVHQTETYGALGTIMNRVRTVLHKASGTTTDGIVIGCVEENVVQYGEWKSGVSYKHVGIYFRIFTQ